MIKILHRMAIFPRWSNLKHFNNVTTTHFTDGQAFYDILKVRPNFVVAKQVIKFTLLVHSSMRRGFPSQEIGPGSLHPCLYTVSNTCWPPLHDRKSIKMASTVRGTPTSPAARPPSSAAHPRSSAAYPRSSAAHPLWSTACLPSPAVPTPVAHPLARRSLARPLVHPAAPPHTSRTL